MPTIWDDLLIIFIFVMPFLILQIFLSTRKKLFWGIIVPVLWTGFGIWTIIRNYMDQSRHIKELIIFYLIGDLIFVGILVIFKYRKKLNIHKV